MISNNKKKSIAEIFSDVGIGARPMVREFVVNNNNPLGCQRDHWLSSSGRLVKYNLNFYLWQPVRVGHGNGLLYTYKVGR